MKSKIGIIFWQGGGHKMQSSSFYIHFDKDDLTGFKTKLFETAKIVKSKDVTVTESFKRPNIKQVNSRDIYTAPASHLF